jgi:alpha-glucosidase
MDYTPVTFSARDRVTTDGHELAMSVVYQSGLQHYADSPESYARYPAATALLAAVPAAWDDTRLVAGHPDRYVVLARRTGARWYVGALSAGPPRTLKIPLRFLAAGGYDARVIGDDLAETDRVVAAGDTLRIRVARNGGATVALTPR